MSLGEISNAEYYPIGHVLVVALMNNQDGMLYCRARRGPCRCFNAVSFSGLSAGELSMAITCSSVVIADKLPEVT